MGSLWNRSGLIERFDDDLPAWGAKAYFYVGGTTTPLTVFKDSLENSAHPRPTVADSKGRWSDVFIPYISTYDVRVTDRYDVELTYSVRIPNPSPADVTVDLSPAQQAQLVQTGSIFAALTDVAQPGYVRLNGNTIGSLASSGGPNPPTERANDDTLALYTKLWNFLPNTVIPVIGGRGVSANDDFFSSNKPMVLPDCRGRALVGVDDMGSNAGSGNFFPSLPFAAGDHDTPASTIGANSLILTLAQMPVHTHAVARGTPGGGGINAMANNAASVDNAGATQPAGSGQAFNNLPRALLVCWYMKL